MLPDGTKSISRHNRNTEEALDIPIGADNMIAPGEANQGQPTHFEPRRHWGVFAVKVPADFSKEVVWTLKVRGQTFAIPGYLHPNWQIDALEGEAGSGNTPPVLKFSATGPEGNGPYGITSGPLTATAGTPLAISVWAKDDGKAASSVASAGRAATPVTLTWFLHQGSGKSRSRRRRPACHPTVARPPRTPHSASRVTTCCACAPTMPRASPVRDTRSAAGRMDL